MKRVFLSFLAEDKKQVDGLRLLAANPKFEIEFYDESVRTPYESTNADYIKQNIRDKISRSSTTVCLLSRNTHTSKWVCWEIEESIKRNNDIILMGLPGITGKIALPSPAKNKSIDWYLWDLAYLTSRIAEKQ